MVLIAVACSLFVIVVALLVIFGFLLPAMPRVESLTEEEQWPNPEKN